MSTRKTVSVRFRELQLEQVIEALEERMYRLQAVGTTRETRAIASAIERCAQARDELMRRGD